jgi:hypothetical protein
MKIEKECPCCGMVYVIKFEATKRESEWNIEEETFEDEEPEIYPEFCPFCGSHEDEEPLDEEDR